MKKHFIIVGAQRSGTTYLYNILDEHPEICMSLPVKPEPKYFMNKDAAEVTLEEYYQLFFNHCTTDIKLTGEKSTSYYEREESAQLISSMLPETDIIFCLRNPVQRALSNYFFSCNNGLEARTLKEVFIDKIDVPSGVHGTSVNPFDYLGRGEYSKFLKMYMKYFSISKIKVVIFEEFVNNLENIQNLYGLLNVDKEFKPISQNKVVNSSEKPANVSDAVFTVLTDYYKPHICELETLIKKELTLWN